MFILKHKERFSLTIFFEIQINNFKLVKYVFWQIFRIEMIRIEQRKKGKELSEQ